MPPIPVDAGRATETGPRDAPPSRVEVALDRYGQEIYRFLRRQVPNADDAADLHQETFLRALRAFDRLPPDANVRAWLYRTAGNLATDLYRRRRPLEQLDGAEDRLRSEGPEGDAAAAELAEVVRLELLRLGSRQRAAVVLRVFEELDYEEVARRLDCTEVTARKHVSLGLAKLRLALEAWR